MKNNLMDILHEEGTLYAGKMVSTSILPELEVYGFIPIDDDDRVIYNDDVMQLLDFKMENSLVVSNRLVIVCQDYVKYGSSTRIGEKRIVHPIVKKVSLQDNGKTYSIHLQQLHLPKFMKQDGYLEYRRCVVYRGYGNKLVKLEGISTKKNEATNTVEYYYTPNSNELLFGDRLPEKPTAISSSFVVVCRRVNPVTGNVVFDLFNPEELFVK